ncbi:hypothetical protein [Pedobacter gandavensis]|uniref:hypothetical protein n=1 Tax=Pedobacter gandavensis TaxID=2679963 RepID=UPI00292CD379|nr:hypothetical protein [Pedobacter gandavensis]
MDSYKISSIIIASAIFLIIGVVGCVTTILQSATGKAYSFHKFQTWLWTLVICPCFALYWGAIPNHVPTINLTALILLGISGVTLLTGEIISQVQMKSAKAVGLTSKSELDSRGFFIDLLLDDDGNLSIARLQQLVFTLVYSVIYVCTFFGTLKYPEYPVFDTTAFVLMGISTGTYLVGKGMRK